MLCGSETLSQGGYGTERFRPFRLAANKSTCRFSGARAIQRSDATPLIGGSLFGFGLTGLDRTGGRLPRDTEGSEYVDPGLFMVSNQCVAQTILEWAEPGLVVLLLEKPRSENWLANPARGLPSGQHVPFAELDAGRFECEAAEVEDALHFSLEIFHDVLVQTRSIRPGSTMSQCRINSR